MLTIFRWRTLDLSWIHMNVDAYGNETTPFNFTGYTFRAQVRERLPRKGKKEKKVVLELPITCPIPANGTLRAVLARDFVNALKDYSPDELEWDLIGLDPNGETRWIVPTQPAQVITPATNPDSGFEINPQLPYGAFAAGISLIDIVDDSWLHIIKNGVSYHVPVAYGPPP